MKLFILEICFGYIFFGLISHSFQLSQNLTQNSFIEQTKSNHYIRPNVIANKFQPITIDVPPLMVPFNFNFGTIRSQDDNPSFKPNNHEIVPSPLLTEPEINDNPIGTRHANENGLLWNRAKPYSKMQHSTFELPKQPTEPSNEIVRRGKSPKKRWFVAIPIYTVAGDQSKFDQGSTIAEPTSNYNNNYKFRPRLINIRH